VCDGLYKARWREQVSEPMVPRSCPHGQSERLHHRATGFARKDEGGADRAPPEIPQRRFHDRGTADLIKDS
jgi:hypothetical protein